MLLAPVREILPSLPPSPSAPPSSAVARKRVAVLVDVENVGPGVVRTAFDLGRSLGHVSQVFGYAGDEHSSARRALADVSGTLRRLPSRRGKNFADLSLTIDAMDLLHREDAPDVFVLATDDVDFLPLLCRLREAGKEVVGLGWREATWSLGAYDRFFRCVGDPPRPRSRRRRSRRARRRDP